MDLSKYAINDNMYSMANMFAKQNMQDYMDKQRRKKGFLANMLAGDYFGQDKSASMAASVQAA